MISFIHKVLCYAALPGTILLALQSGVLPTLGYSVLMALGSSVLKALEQGVLITLGYPVLMTLGSGVLVTLESAVLPFYKVMSRYEQSVFLFVVPLHREKPPPILPEGREHTGRVNT